MHSEEKINITIISLYLYLCTAQLVDMEALYMIVVAKVSTPHRRYILHYQDHKLVHNIY